MKNHKALLALLLAAPALVFAQTAATPASPSATRIGEVALVTGVVTAAMAGVTQRLGVGDALYEGQAISVGANSYVNLKFADGGRVLLRPNTEFTVESFKYKAPEPLAPTVTAPAAPASVEGTAFFRLVRGGFRAISGLIGKVDHQAYKVTTPVATIGIRGTDYEVQTCAQDCPAQPVASNGAMFASTDVSGLQLAQQGEPPAPDAAGVIFATHEGSIEVNSGGSTFRVDAGQVGVMLAGGQGFMLPVIPDPLLHNPAPSPEACQ